MEAATSEAAGAYFARGVEEIDKCLYKKRRIAAEGPFVGET